ncbi:YybH family protein [Anabaena azotica]|uniref:YybH family protein n=1 Tax=Anabaena azotica TaxID=197653 RepID=UPI0039A71314
MISADKEEIRMIFEEVYPNNVRERNLELYGQMYTSDALWMPPNAPDRCGIPDILEGFALTIADKYIDPTFTAEEIKVIDDIGYVIGISIANICPMDGSPSTQAHYRALWVMKKEYGCWKIDRQIWNNKPLN